MNTPPIQESGKAVRTPLAKGNEALRQGNHDQAIAHYAQAIIQQPGLAKIISANLEMARHKYRASRQTSAKPSVAVCGWELAHNAAGRAYTLATIYETYAHVEIIGSLFPNFGREIWEPIRDTPIAKHTFIVEDESQFLEQAIQLVAAHPYDIVHLSKPRAPNILFGILYKLFWDAKVLMDIDDEELAFVGEETPITIDDYIKQHGKLPELKHLAGKDWTRIAVGLAKDFDGVTVCNAALQKRYGGEIIRHARDEKLFKPSTELKSKSRDKYGIPQDKKVVLFFGTPREHKGLIETAQAIAGLKRTDVIFCIVGTFADEKLKQRLIAVDGCNFVFLPNQPVRATPEILSIADCCLLLQDSKSTAAQYQTPAKLSDALAMGVPVLCSVTPALEEYVQLGAIQKTSIQELKQHLASVLKPITRETDKESNGRSTFSKLLSITACANGLKNSVSQLSSTTNGKAIKNIAHLLFSELRPKGDLPTAIVFLLKNTPAEQKHRITSLRKDTSIDIVVPVFNALDDVKRCLVSLEEHTDGCRVHVFVINDASGEDTTQWLRNHCKDNPLFSLIEHPNNLGYTRAVNTGLKASDADFVITQNSDTIVSAGWLNGMVRCMESDPKIGIVGPLSNAASWQNVPNLRDESGSFAVNELPEGFNVQDMARMVARASKRTYPRLPFVNGFCFMIRRAVIDAIGYMDEENFPIGYGEENDFCIRAIDAGYQLVIADDVFVFHAKSKSFGHERRKVLSEQGTTNLKRKHTAEKYTSRLNAVKRTEELDAVRVRINKYIDEKASTFSVDLIQMRILFLLPVQGGSGGAHSVVQEVTEMRRLGIQAHIGMWHDQVAGFVKSYADISEAKNIFKGFDDLSLLDLADNYDVVVGTIYSSMTLVKNIVDSSPHILPAYYVQDYEPMFFEEGSTKFHEAHGSYTLVPGALLFAKTHWIINEVNRHHGVAVHKVQPSIDHNVYKPAQRQSNSRINVTAMIRPQTPRRGAERTMRLFKRLHQVFGDKLAISVFGCESNSDEFLKLESDFPFVNHGKLLRPQVAALLAESDLFIDLSDYQAFGRTALEAMACSCAAVVPSAGGADEYAVNYKNALIVDTRNEIECFDVISKLLAKPDELFRLKREGFATASRYSVHAAAVSEILAIEKALRNWRKERPSIIKPTLLLIPSLSSDKKMVTGSGYVRVLLPYRSPSLLKQFKVRQSQTLPSAGDAEIVLLQRDLTAYSIPELNEWLHSWKIGGGKLVYELDDDLLDAKQLKMRNPKGDGSVTASKVSLLISAADIVHVSTETLAEKIRAINPQVHVVPNVLDAGLWQLATSRRHDQGPYCRQSDGPIRIGYIGTPTHDADLDMITEAMGVIERKYAGKVEIEVIGGFQNRAPTFGKRVGLPKKHDYPNFVRWLHERVHWDIGVIPLVEDQFNNSKSYLKFLECAALDMALVVSDVTSYRPVARHGHNCLLAQPITTDWIEKISQLIDDKVMRLRLAQQARVECTQRHTIESVAPTLTKRLASI